VSKTKKLLAGVSTSALIMATLSGCGEEETLPIPEDTECEDWDWDSDLGVWECDDYDSPHYGFFFYGAKYYTKKSLKSSSSYKTYKSSSSFKGFGSGNKSYGG
jgi:hypothetical protein